MSAPADFEIQTFVTPALTQTYSRMHEAFASVAAIHGIEPFAARVLLAVDECGGSVTSDVLEQAMDDRHGGSQIRRSLLTLYVSGHVTGTSPDGGRRKRGTRTLVTLSPSGRVATTQIRGLVFGADSTFGTAA